MKHWKWMLLLLPCVLCTMQCSMDPFVEDGSSSEIIAINGGILDTEGKPASDVIVYLIPFQHDPVKESIDSFCIDTTNGQGIYQIKIPKAKAGVYSIQAVDMLERTRLLHPEVRVFVDPVIISTDTLRKPGSIKVYLPDSADVINGYVYLPGTTRYKHLNGSNRFVVLDSVPAGLIPAVTYAEDNSTIRTVIRYEIVIPESDTFVVTMPSWLYSRQLFLNTTATGAQVPRNVLNFPVLVRLTAANFEFSQAKTDGSDIRFTKNDNSLLYYEIETWDASANQAAIWVKVDTVYGNNNTQNIHMAWGSSSAAGVTDAAAVFDTSHAYRGVWHLGKNLQDATINSVSGTNYGTEDSPGIIGYSRKFDIGDSIRIPGLAGTPPSITLSAWANLEMTDDSGSEVVSVGNAVLLRMDDTRFNNTWGTMASFHSNNTHYDFVYRQYLAKTGWHHIAFTIDNITAKQYFYVDGILHDSGAITTPINYTGVGKNILLGSRGQGSTIYSFTGLIDEVRISRAALSYDYIKLCYMNQKSSDALVVNE